LNQIAVTIPQSDFLPGRRRKKGSTWTDCQPLDPFRPCIEAEPLGSGLGIPKADATLLAGCDYHALIRPCDTGCAELVASQRVTGLACYSIENQHRPTDHRHGNESALRRPRQSDDIFGLGDLPHLG
jgi:hypothetical protein